MLLVGFFSHKPRSRQCSVVGENGVRRALCASVLWVQQTACRPSRRLQLSCVSVGVCTALKPALAVAAAAEGRRPPRASWAPRRRAASQAARARGSRRTRDGVEQRATTTNEREAFENLLSFLLYVAARTHVRPQMIIWSEEPISYYYYYISFPVSIYKQ